MDDEQGPWWTRPPEPGPQAPVVSQPQQGDEEPDDGIVTPRAKEPEQFETWGGGFATPPAGTNPWDPEEQPDHRPASGTAETGAQPTAVQSESLFEPAPAPEAPAPEAPPQPEPRALPEPPKPPKQVIRRVAVVDPNPPPSNDRTETLPALGDDIFAVFDAQGRQGHGAPVTQVPPPPDPFAGDDPLSHLRDEPHPHRVHLPKVQLPEPRFMLMAVGSGLVVLLVLLVVLLFGRNGDDKTPTAAATPEQTKNTVAAAVAGTEPKGLAKLTNVQAGELLAKAGQGDSGQIVEAWSWTDKNGKNLVVTTTEVTGANRKTLRVVHVADLDGKPRTLRVMKDPNLPVCKNRSAVGFAGFTKNSMVIRDLNDDGIAEVTAGWTSRCGAKGGTSEIKLALITDGKKYIVRDTGVVGKAGGGSADPRSSRWPDGFYPAVTKIWKKLYG